jgi:ribosomal protein L37AE/L43A
MASDGQSIFDGMKMRANLKIVEERCAICNNGYTLGEEVYSCSACNGYHHVACVETGPGCPHLSAELRAAAPAQTAAPVAAPPEPPVASTPPPPAAPVRTPEQQLRWQQIAENYSRWGTQSLEKAYNVDRSQYDPFAVEVMAEELKRRHAAEPWTCAECGTANPPGEVCTNQANHVAPAAAQPVVTGPPLGPDEKRCPQCAEIIRKEAVKCRFCGANVEENAGLAAMFRERLEGGVPVNVASEMESTATSAMWFGIASPFCCSVVLGPIAIIKGNRAMKLLNEYPEFERHSTVAAKARAGQIIGWISIGLFILGILYRAMKMQ